MSDSINHAKLITAVIIVAAFCTGIWGIPLWVSTPPNPTYAERGYQVFLNWTFSHNSNPSRRKWYKSTESGTQIGKAIMSKYGANAVIIHQTEYEGRLAFVENGGLVLKNVSLFDEGFIRFDVDFEDGSNLGQHIMLNVTVRPSIKQALPNEVVIVEHMRHTLECIFESRPTPDVKWYLNEVLQANGSRLNTQNQITEVHKNLTTVKSTLTIQKARLDDAGSISCMAEIPFGNLSSTSRLIVHYAPKSVNFTTDKANDIAYLGERVKFECNTTSLPSSSYLLFHNDVMMMNSTNETFEIASVSLANEGSYKCSAYNYIGSSAVATRNLTIHVHPFVVTNLANAIIGVQGKSKTINCTFKAKPAPTVKWFMKETLLLNGSRIQIHTRTEHGSSSMAHVESSITITNVMLEDAGNIRCEATLSFGNASSATKFLVHYAPKSVSFTTNKANDIAYLGERVKFECNTTSLPSSSYLLFHNDVMMMNSTNETFEIASVSLANEGSYKCSAYNYIGSSAVATRNLTIHVAPELHSSSADARVLKNNSVTLSCVFLGDPAPVVTWYKLHGGSHLLVNSTTRIIVANSSFTVVQSSISFRNVKRIDHGSYQCEAVNRVGRARKNLTIDVIYLPVMNVTFKNKYTFEDDRSKNASWLCELESNPVGKVTWHRNGKVISSDGFETITTILSNQSTGVRLRSELKMIGITRDKAGILSCNASNEVGFEIKETMVIVHFVPNNLTMLPARFLLVNGSGSLEMECTFDANPDASISWKYNNTEIVSRSMNITENVLHSDVYYTRKRSALRIEMVEEQFQGMYECIAMNPQGNNTQQTALIVHYTPMMLLSLASEYVKNENENLVLHCKARSNPLAQLHWYRDGAEVFNNSKTMVVESLVSQNQYHQHIQSELRVNMLTKNDSGNYSCRANNLIGSKTEQTKLIVQYSPEISSSFAKIENLTESSAPFSLRCSVEAFPKATVTWYYNGDVSHENSTETFHRITNAKILVQSILTFPNGIKRYNNGTFTCNANNSVGSASKSVLINVWYVPEMVSQLNGTQNYTKMSNVTFECKAEGHPAPFLKWFRSGTILQNVPVTFTKHSDTKTQVKSTLYLTGVTKNDSAIYKCEADNIAGKEHQSVTLNVLYTPVLPVIPPNVTANQSQRVELDCFADANPPVQRYNWTKDGNLLPFTRSKYIIPFAQEASAGIYRCHPIYSMAFSSGVTFHLHIQVPAHITKRITCTQSNPRLVCTCAGHGIPKPFIYWTKDNSTSILGTGSTYNLTVERGRDGRYHCNAINKLAHAIDTYNVFFLDTPVGEWSLWTACNVSCGAGSQQRTRKCNFQPCPEHLIESRGCNRSCTTTPNSTAAPATTLPFGKKGAQKSSDDAWSIVLYVLIPVLAVLAIILIIWLANVRGCRREEKEFIVPLNNSLSQPPSIRSMPTRRGIYLPDNNFGVLNSGYRPDDNADNLHNADSKKYDTIEVEMQFGNDFSETNTEEAPPGDAKNGQIIENKDELNEDGRLSFYNSTYTHL